MRNNESFRVNFARISDLAIVTRTELAELLATTAAAISQMAYRGELPQTAFPHGRRACWFAGDIKAWLNANRRIMAQPTEAPLLPQPPSEKRIGRPRKVKAKLS